MDNGRIHANLDENGNLVLQGHTGIDSYALKQWEKQRAAGKAKLIIKNEPYFDWIADLAKEGSEWKKAYISLKKKNGMYEKFLKFEKEQSKIEELEK